MTHGERDGGWEFRVAEHWSKQAVSERAGPWAGLEHGKEASRQLEKEPRQPQVESTLGTGVRS